MGKGKCSDRFSEDDEDAPLANKRPRFAEPASPPQPPVVAEEDEEEEEEEGFVIGDGLNLFYEQEGFQTAVDLNRLYEPERFQIRDDLQGFVVEEDDEDNELDELVVEEEEEYGVQYAAVEPGSEGGNSQEQMPSTSTAPPVFTNENRTLQAEFTDPDVLDCPICFDPLDTPVFQCENGHIACSSCCSDVENTCPSCRMPIGSIRCRAVEKILESVKVSCKYSHNGCKAKMPYTEKNHHEKICLYVTCFCPHPSCLFSGYFKNLYVHFRIQHAASTTRFTYNTTFTLDVELHQKHIFLQNEDNNGIFILNQEVKEHGRGFNVDRVGPKFLTCYYMYKLTAKNMRTSLSLKSEPEVYAKWSENTSRKNCLTVPSEFPGYNRVLSLDVCIKRIQYGL